MQSDVFTDVTDIFKMQVFFFEKKKVVMDKNITVSNFEIYRFFFIQGVKFIHSF